MPRNRTSRPPSAIDSRDAEISRLRVLLARLRAENAALRARIEAGKGELRKKDDPRAALKAAGITRARGQKRRENAVGLARLYVRFLTNPPAAVRWNVPTAASLREEQRSYEEFARFLEGGEPPAVREVDGRDEREFVPDSTSPMSPRDALRNLAAFTGQSERAAWRMLRREQDLRLEDDDAWFELPPRPR